jgi:hypothetical protein
VHTIWRRVHLEARPVSQARLVAHHRHGGCSFEVNVGLAADIDSDPFYGATCESVRRRSRVVVGDGLAAVSPDSEAFFADHELVGLGLDAPFADLGAPVSAGASLH